MDLMLLMQSSKKPTINLVVLAVIDVERSLQETIEEAILSPDSASAEFKGELAREVKQCVQGRMRPFTRMELLGASLDPEVKNIRQIHDEIPDESAANFLYEAIHEYVPESTSDEEVATQPPFKQKRTELIARYSSSMTAEENVLNEVHRYMAHRVELRESTRKSDDDRVSTWWRENSTLFPRVAKLARVILSIPATSAEPERRFSAAGNVLRERRCSMSPLTMTKTLFIHDNKHFLTPEKDI